ncbi:MAG: PKD domain-containing protein, partial [Thermoplasmata archaeon]
GLAFEDVYPEYEVTNANRTITYSPYTAEATLGDLFNITTIPISGNPNITLVLRPVIDLPPVVAIIAPREGGEYDVWELGNRIPFEGSVVDPEEGEVTWAWYLDGELVNDEELEFELELVPGVVYEVALMGVDGSDHETWVYHNFSVISVPPEDNYVEIISPEDEDVFDMGEEFSLVCEYYVLDHPELEGPVALPVRWTSDRDGLLIEEEEGTIDDLTPGTHVITVIVEPRFPEFIGEPYTASVVIEVLPPEPVATAVISSPEDGSEFPWDATVHLAANGSSFDIWDPPEYRVIYRWSSDIDGLLGEGKELDARHLATGTHTITLLLSTDPFLVSDGASITIVVHPEPNNPPVARITVITAMPKAGEPMRMTATLSADPDGDILTYSWDLGDGNISTSVEVNHTYEAGGNYTLRLTVFDGEAEGVESLVIEVAPPDDPDNGGNGGGGDGDGDGDDGTVEASDTWLGWLFIVLLLAAVGAMLFLLVKGRSSEG